MLQCNKCAMKLWESCLLISCDTLINIFQCVESDSHSSGCVCSSAWLWYWQDHEQTQDVAVCDWTESLTLESWLCAANLWFGFIWAAQVAWCKGKQTSKCTSPAETHFRSPCSRRQAPKFCTNTPDTVRTHRKGFSSVRLRGGLQKRPLQLGRMSLIFIPSFEPFLYIEDIYWTILVDWYCSFSDWLSVLKIWKPAKVLPKNAMQRSLLKTPSYLETQLLCAYAHMWICFCPDYQVQIEINAPMWNSSHYPSCTMDNNLFKYPHKINERSMFTIACGILTKSSVEEIQNVCNARIS